jgi:hypothetical protein
MASTAPAHAAMLGRPRAIALLARALTLPVASRAIAGAWSLYWNDLVAGATPRPSLSLARAVAQVGAFATARSDAARSIMQTLEGDDPLGTAPDRPGDAATAHPSATTSSLAASASGGVPRDRRSLRA